MDSVFSCLFKLYSCAAGSWHDLFSVLFESWMFCFTVPRRETARGWVGSDFIDFQSKCCHLWMSWQIQGSLGHCVIRLLLIETIPLMKASAHDTPARVRTCSIEPLSPFVLVTHQKLSSSVTDNVSIPEHALVRLRSPALRTRVCGDLVGRRVGVLNGKPPNNCHGACLLVRGWASMSMATCCSWTG